MKRSNLALLFLLVLFLLPACKDSGSELFPVESQSTATHESASTAETKTAAANYGILIAAHGMPGTWNANLNSWAKPFKATSPYPLEVGFLEYTPSQTIAKAIQKLEARGVEKIFLIQVMVSANSSHTPEIYEAVQNATASTPVICIAEGFADAPEMVESLIQRGKTACFIDDNLLGDKREIDYRDASLVITFHGEPWGDVSGWTALGESLKQQIEAQNIFRSVDYAINLSQRIAACDRAAGFPVVVPQYVVAGAYVDAGHPEILIKRNAGKLKYDGRCILDDENAAHWLERHIEGIAANSFTSYWTNGIAVD